jgi:hypothetical protein
MDWEPDRLGIKCRPKPLWMADKFSNEHVLPLATLYRRGLEF